MPDKLRAAFGPAPGFNEMDPRWNDYMRSVSDWYDRMGYPGFNPFLPQARSRSPLRLMKRSRSRSLSAGRKRKRSVSPAENRRSRSRELDAHGRDLLRRSRSRDSGSRQRGFTDRDTRSSKQPSKSHYSKQEPKLDSRTGKSNRVVKQRGKDSRPADMGIKDRAPKRGLHRKSSNTAQRGRKIDVLSSKQQIEPVQTSADYQQSSLKACVEEKTGAAIPVVKLIPTVQQKPKIMSLMDVKITGGFRQPAAEHHYGKRQITEAVTLKQAVEVDQKLITATADQRSHLKVDRDKTVVVSKKADVVSKKIDESPAEPPSVVDSVEQGKEMPSEAPASPPAAIEPGPEPTAEEPLTTEVTEMTDTQQSATDEPSEPDSKPEPVNVEQQVAADKSEVSTKNIAQVKPLLVASVPEKSRWEREADVFSDSHDSPMYASRNRSRPTLSQTTLPR